MPKQISIFLFILIFTTFSKHFFCQEKYEKESRLKENLVPKKALYFIDSLELNKKVKWYFEESLSDETIEAKFKTNGRKFSIEFDTTGKVEDVEIEIKTEELKKELKEKIDLEIRNNCKNHKIIKIQKQHTGSETTLLAISKANVLESHTENIEVVVKCVTEKSTDLYEYLFNSQGDIISTVQIILKNSAHLEY